MFQLLNYRLVSASVFALATAACGGTAVTEIIGPDPVRCQATLAAPQTPVPSNGAELSVPVSAARECSWTVASEASWIRVSPSSGQGEASLTLLVAENGAASARTGTITLNDVRVTLAQEPAPCRFELNRTQAAVPHTGGTTTVELTTLEGCDWRATTSAPWIRVMNASGRSSATVLFQVEPNTGARRAADVMIAGLRFTIDQDVPPPPAPPTPPPAPAPPTPPPAPPTPPVPPPTNPTPPPAGSAFEASGSLSGLSGSCPALTFKLRGTTIVTDGSTRFNGGNCRSIKDGDRVDVQGVYLANGSVLAERVRRDDDDDDDDDE